MVIWTPRARADLKAIHDHIAEDAPMDAGRVVNKIAEKVNLLETAPRSGKVVPEIREPHLREIHLYSWRVIYHLKEEQVYIVTLVHKRRDLQAEDIPGKI